MITDINSEDRLVQQTFAEHLRDVLGWESVYAYNDETFGPDGTLGRDSEREVVLVRDLRAALARLNPDLAGIGPRAGRREADPDRLRPLAHPAQPGVLRLHPRRRAGRVAGCRRRDAARPRPGDRFPNGIGRRQPNNRFLAVRELKIQGLRVPHYNRRADLVCFVNGLPLVFIELKAVYRNIRAGFDDNLTDYLSEHSIAHAFHHNAFLVVSNGDHARYGSITSKWEHFVEWKRNDEKDKGSVDAEALLDGMLAKERLLDLVENFILFDDSKPGGTRKIVARNHQVLGVNNAVASVQRQEELKRQYPAERAARSRYRGARDRSGRRFTEALGRADAGLPKSASRRAVVRPSDDEHSETAAGQAGAPGPRAPGRLLAHAGQRQVLLHGRSSPRRCAGVVPGNFTFLVMTDREDLDDQICRTFVGCGVADEKTPRASSGQGAEGHCCRRTTASSSA